jgi:8-oxo-dGTP pyrophosphatase MutT (NUDIX family)
LTLTQRRNLGQSIVTRILVRGKSWFHAGIILPNEKHGNAIVRELFEETGLTLTVDDLIPLSGAHVRVLYRATNFRMGAFIRLAFLSCT